MDEYICRRPVGVLLATRVRFCRPPRQPWDAGYTWRKSRASSHGCKCRGPVGVRGQASVGTSRRLLRRVRRRRRRVVLQLALLRARAELDRTADRGQPAVSIWCRHGLLISGVQRKVFGSPEHSRLVYRNLGLDLETWHRSDPRPWEDLRN